MPELPEVETTVRKLRPLIGKTIQKFESDWPRGLKVSTPDFIRKDIRGKKITTLSRRGKAILFGLENAKKKDDERMLAFHQRMSGRMVILSDVRTGGKKLKMEEKHVRVKIHFSDGEELWFHDPRKFGIVWYGKKDEVLRDRYFANLGADALFVPFSEFQRGLLAHRGMLKPLLLRQDVFAGIGNIVADEMLWEAKIHPQKKSEVLSPKEIRALFRALKKVLARSIRAKGTTLRDWGHPDGERGGFQDYMRVYGKKGARCGRCGREISRIVVGGRGSWICKRCQVPP